VCVVVPFEPLRIGLVAELSTAPDIQIVGEFASLAEVISKAVLRQADVLILDSQEVLSDNLAVYSQIDEWLPTLKVLFLGAQEDSRAILALRVVEVATRSRSGALDREEDHVCRHTDPDTEYYDCRSA
jgi:DNA-binding NarL/FixJ family response regulator